MRRVFWLRHSPTHAKTMVGWSDIPADLSEAPRLEALRAVLPSGALVVSSDLKRAVQTADAVQEDRRRLTHRAALREIHFGAWELQRFDAVRDQARLRRFWEAPGDITPPCGESWNALRQRVCAEVDTLFEETGAEDLVIVAHFGAILAHVQQALGVTTTEVFAHKIEPLSLTQVQHDGTRWQAVRINHDVLTQTP